MNPLFSIIIPTYNRANFIRRAISSVLNQTFQNFEIIVVDDGSTDNTREIVSLIDNIKILYFHKVNEERSIARNYGITKSTGEYISFLDSDDVLYMNHLEIANNNIQRLKNPEILHLDYEFRDESGKVISRGAKLPDLLNDHLLGNSQIGVLGVFIRRDIAMLHPFLAYRRAIVGEDLYLWLVLASRYPFHHVSKVTSVIELHEGRSLNIRDGLKFLKSTLLIIKNLSKDDEFIKYYSRSRANYFFAKNLIQVALIYAEQAQHKWACKLLSTGVNYSWRIIFNRTFLATIRALLFKSVA